MSDDPNRFDTEEEEEKEDVEEALTNGKATNLRHSTQNFKDIFSKSK
jgi:hypothetical protein